MLSDSGIPFVDAHFVNVNASSSVTWQALLEVLRKSIDSPRKAFGARLLGCSPNHSNGIDLSEIGATLPGFQVTGADQSKRLELEGRHRFSRYKLVFVLEPLTDSCCRLGAETWAAFPGPAGRVYGTLVVGSRGHMLAVRSMLTAARRRAVRQ